MKLVTRKGETVEVPDEQAADALASGQYGIRGDAHLTDPTGTVVKVNPNDVLNALQQGYMPATEEQAEKQHLENKYGGAAGTAIGFGEGAIRGATLGVADPLAIGAAGLFGGEEAAQATREHLLGYKEAHPVASTVGEIGGVVAPLVLSGGTAAPEAGAALGGEAALGAAGAAEAAQGGGLVARALGGVGEGVRALGTLPRAAGAVGHFAEGIGEHLVGEGATSMLGRFAQHVVPNALGAAAEGSLYKVGEGISESALQNKDYTAETLLSDIGHGALIGAAAGGVLSTAKFAFDAAANKLGEKFGPQLKEFLETQADREAVRTVHPRTAAMKDLANLSGGLEGGVKQVGQDMLNELPRVTGKPFGTMTLRDIAEGATAVKEEMGERLGASMRKLDELGVEVAPSAESITKRIQSEVLDPIADRPGFKGVEREIKNYISEFETATKEGMGFESLQGLRKDVDALANWKSHAPSLTEKAFRDVRGILENELVTSGEKAAAKLGAGFAEEYKATKRIYQSMLWTEKAAEKSLIAKGINRTFSLTDYMSGNAAFMAATIAHGSINPASLAIGFVTGAVNKFFRQHGSQMAAAGFDKLAKMSAIEKIGQASEEKLTNEVTALMEGLSKRYRPLVNTLKTTEFELAKKGAGGAIVKGERGEQAEGVAERAVTPTVIHLTEPQDKLDAAYRQRVANVAAHATNPTLAANAIQAQLGSLVQHDPDLTAKFAEKTQAATQFLQSKIPKGHVNTDSLSPQLTHPQVPTSEKAKFLRYAQGVDHPLAILQDARANRLSHEQVEAVKTVYPETFGKIRQAVLEKASELKKQLPYQTRMQLGTLLGIPTDESLKGNFVQAIQGSVYGGGKGKPPQAEPPANKPPARPLNVASRSRTEIQKIEES